MHAETCDSDAENVFKTILFYYIQIAFEFTTHVGYILNRLIGKLYTLPSVGD